MGRGLVCATCRFLDSTMARGESHGRGVQVFDATGRASSAFRQPARLASQPPRSPRIGFSGKRRIKTRADGMSCRCHFQRFGGPPPPDATAVDSSSLQSKSGAATTTNRELLPPPSRISRKNARSSARGLQRAERQNSTHPLRALRMFTVSSGASPPGHCGMAGRTSGSRPPT